ncbi:MAG: hypothetical protein GY851_22430 [bacterium]|nr:hypothetical protein [bacterium]
MTAKRGRQIQRRTLLRGLGAMAGAGLASGPVQQAAHAAAAGEHTPMEPLNVPTWYYKHHDADFRFDVPEEGFGGWHKEALELSRDRTAVVSMHAWDAGTMEEFPGWWRVVPYIPRANEIVQTVFPKLFTAVRASGMPLFHVVGGGDYYKDLPGYKRAEAMAKAAEPLEHVESDPIRDRLAEFKRTQGYPTERNVPDIQRGFERVDFPREARPMGEEGVAENGAQLFALCKEAGINHLIYCGFAINWCLLLSPGGMAEMQKYGLMCSALRQATTAVENKDSARREWCKELGLWRVALSFGFVYDVDDLVGALQEGAVT